MMKVLLLLTLVVKLLVVHGVPQLLHYEEFEAFKSTHGKQYGSLQEEHRRLEIFSDNMRKITQHNKLYEQGVKTYTMGVTRFADWTSEEFVRYLTAQGNPPATDGYNVTFRRTGAKLPTWVDWRDFGAVTEVKDQGMCGSCWSFSTTGAVEGAYYMSARRLVSLSEQHLVDCCSKNYGCHGGYMETALAYVAEHGLAGEFAYPYTGHQQKCRYNSAMAAVRTHSYGHVEETEEALMEAVARLGPVSVAVDATYFQLYKEGVFYEPRCIPTRLNHGVLAVGYGSENGSDFWTVKNSWSDVWGELGYIRMSRQRDNNCGIASDANYAIV